MSESIEESVDEIRKLAEISRDLAITTIRYCEDILAPVTLDVNESVETVEMGQEKDRSLADDDADEVDDFVQVDDDLLNITQEEEYEFMHPGYQLTWPDDMEKIYFNVKNLAQENAEWDSDEFTSKYIGDSDELYHGLVGYYPRTSNILPQPKKIGREVLKDFLGPTSFDTIPYEALEQVDRMYYAEYLYHRDKFIKHWCGYFV